MAYAGTREKASCWKATSIRKLIKAEKAAWEVAAQNLNYLDSYFVSIEFDQSYPTFNGEEGMTKHKDEETLSEGDSDEEMSGLLDKDYISSDKKTKSRTCTSACSCLCGKKTQVRKTTSTEYIMTYEFGKKGKPVMVLLHGYCGSALTYYQMFPELQNDYHVFCIDLLGMGCSSRPRFLAENTKEANLFFVESFELWRSKMNIPKMNLVGHSLGGYISTKYAVMYPERVTQMLLLSPMGMENDPRVTVQSFREPEVDQSFFKRHLFSLGKCLVRSNKSPLDVLRCFGRFVAPFLIKDYIRRKFCSMSKEDYDKLYPYLYQITMTRGSGEYGMSKLIEADLLAFEPLYYDLMFLKDKIPVSVAYGDQDYINTKFHGSHISETLLQEGFDIHIVPQSSHQVYLDNPQDCVKLIKGVFRTAL